MSHFHQVRRRTYDVLVHSRYLVGLRPTVVGPNRKADDQQTLFQTVFDVTPRKCDAKVLLLVMINSFMFHHF